MWSIRLIALLGAFGSIVLGSGCGPAATPSEIKNEPTRAVGELTLYDRLGGGAAIYAITDNFIDRLLSDPRVNFAREGHAHTWSATPDSVGRLKLYWAQFIDMLADGPQVYEGHNMLDVHHGMDVSESEWVALLQDLKLTLDHFRVPPDQQKELLTRVAATHDTVVNH